MRPILIGTNTHTAFKRGDADILEVFACAETLLVNSVALWKQEARDPARAAALKAQPEAPFLPAWQRFIRNGRARRFLWAVGLGTAAFNMQDIVLEPYGG